MDLEFQLDLARELDRQALLSFRRSASQPKQRDKDGDVRNPSKSQASQPADWSSFTPCQTQAGLRWPLRRPLPKDKPDRFPSGDPVQKANRGDFPSGGLPPLANRRHFLSCGPLPHANRRGFPPGGLSPNASRRDLPSGGPSPRANQKDRPEFTWAAHSAGRSFSQLKTCFETMPLLRMRGCTFSILRKLDPKESELELVRKPPKVSRGCGGSSSCSKCTTGPSGSVSLQRECQKVVGQTIGNRRIGNLQEFRFWRPKMTLSETINGPLGNQK